jgi:hypothetical protein
MDALKRDVRAARAVVERVGEGGEGGEGGVGQTATPTGAAANAVDQRHGVAGRVDALKRDVRAARAVVERVAKGGEGGVGYRWEGEREAV